MSRQEFTSKIGHQILWAFWLHRNMTKPWKDRCFSGYKWINFHFKTTCGKIIGNYAFWGLQKWCTLICVCVCRFHTFSATLDSFSCHEQKSENNLEGSSFLTIDCRFLINCHLKTGKSTILGANQIMSIFAGFIHLAPPSIETSF